MGRLIGINNSENYGEKFFVDKAVEYLDDECIIYRNRQLYGREFDVCILLPGKGILVVELKGWKEENILQVENNESIAVQTADGIINAAPQKQARGYRFSIERHIRQNYNKFPLVFQMVCLPQVSRQFYRSHRLDVVLEERFTILKEDLTDKVSFFAILDRALREVCKWKRDPFDQKTMLEVRNLFETNVEVHQKDEQEKEHKKAVQYRDYDYSRFYYKNLADSFSKNEIENIIEEYQKGCKLYCILSKSSQMLQLVTAIDQALSKRGLVRTGDSIDIDFNNERNHTPEISEGMRAFSCFHCSINMLFRTNEQISDSFMIKNGECTEEQKKLLYILSANSMFNVEQYLVEHASVEKNIVIRAGAGTGKTYTMISRIGYICYTQNVPLQNMSDRIVMITFTNEAADQMEEKLKDNFRNAYLLTSSPEYLEMISRIDHMQISTIHSYAKNLISQLGTSFGYGIDLGITSSDYYRRRKISDLLDDYIQQKEREYGKTYTAKLGMPVYAIRDNILDFIRMLHNKSVDICSIEPQDFGGLNPGDIHLELHELLATIIPAVEKEYSGELLENNRIHLNSMMSILNRYINAPESKERILQLTKGENVPRFMFVDEFQDTDDSQIDSLLKIADILNYRMFLVGDIKQCIYRFRGAKEKAFDQLKIEDQPDLWQEFSLQRNYRTDAALLNLFDQSFSAWGLRDDELLSYDKAKDKLIGTRDYNSYLSSTPEKYYRRIVASSDNLRIPLLVQEIKRIQSRIEYEEKRGKQLSAKEKSIAILVRENWQAELIRKECGRLGITVHTSTGGDLYMSQPALDMLTLVNALVHFDEADYLYNLVVSNFFSLDVPKSNLYEIRMKIRTGGWKAKVDEKEQVNYLINLMNLMLANTADKNNKWEYIISSLRTQPILQAIRKVYSTLEPWKHFSNDPWKQHYYQLNVDLLFEQIINACNIDRLTINSLQEQLYNSIVSQVSVDSRLPASNDNDLPIQSITVHKAKGLEYGHVILPFCSASMDYIKNSQLHVSTYKQGGRCCIGYSLNIADAGQIVQNDYYNEIAEQSEKAREETRILYVAMTRAIRSFSWIAIEGKQNLSWQNLIETGA